MADFPTLHPGANILTPGTYGVADLHRLKGVQVGPLAPLQAIVTAGAVATRLNDGCSDVLFDGLLWRLCGRAVWATGSDNLRWKRCRWERCGAEAWIGGNLTNALLEDCEAVGPHDGPKFGTSAGDPSKRHGYYTGYGSTGTTIRRCLARGVTGAGVHANGTTDETGRYETGLTVDACRILDCGSSGTGGIDLDCTRKARILDTLIAGCRGGLTCAGNGQGSGQGCRDVHLLRCTLYEPNGLFVVNMAEDSEGTLLEECLIACGPGVDLYRVDDNSLPPHFKNCVLVGVSATDYPGEYFDGCEFYPWASLNSVLPNSESGDYGSAAGVQVGWRPGAPPPVVPPLPPPPAAPLTDAERDALLRDLLRRVEELERAA